MIDRDDIAAAITLTATVDGAPWEVVGYHTAPATPVAGDAWPIWDSSLWRNGCVVEDEWRVIVVLPAGSWVGPLDAVRHDIPAALYDKGIGLVGRGQHIQYMAAENAPVPAVQFAFTA